MVQLMLVCLTFRVPNIQQVLILKSNITNLSFYTKIYQSFKNSLMFTYIYNALVMSITYNHHLFSLSTTHNSLFTISQTLLINISFSSNVSHITTLKSIQHPHPRVSTISALSQKLSFVSMYHLLLLDQFFANLVLSFKVRYFYFFAFVLV